MSGEAGRQQDRQAILVCLNLTKTPGQTTISVKSMSILENAQGDHGSPGDPKYTSEV